MTICLEARKGKQGGWRSIYCLASLQRARTLLQPEGRGTPGCDCTVAPLLPKQTNMWLTHIVPTSFMWLMAAEIPSRAPETSASNTSAALFPRGDTPLDGSTT